MNEGKVNSRISGLRDLEPDARRAVLGQAAGVCDTDLAVLAGGGALATETANGMIENVIGCFELPLGVATNFIVNGQDVLVPMAIEEPSVVAAASNMARIARGCGGFHVTSTAPIMRAQVQVLGVADIEAAKARLLAEKDAILALANAKDKVLIGLGGGARDIEVHLFAETPIGPMVVLHLLVDVRDAMGANTVNTMAETVAPMVETIAQGVVRLRILSNLADRRLVRAHVRLTPEALTTKTRKGSDVAQGIVEACALAMVDPYRAATHNKGIMNGIDPVVLATGNDWRAIEAGAHSYAARGGCYTSLTRWEVDDKGDLNGVLEVPMAVGIVGGATKTHPAAQAALAMMGHPSSERLGQVIVAVGLAQNLAALRALSGEGIQKGHMALHARNIAIMAGATGADVALVANAIVAAEDISLGQAKQVLAGL
ncbi:MAG: hydroxymethylglutaryl-CoA reductase, degradative [Rhodobacterales bacterium]|nr:hydroxymethylglutaryl-CoA reductase, degradative [Rhodobacterales bacterium]